MKIISLNVNGFYKENGKGNNAIHDYYDFEKIFNYLKYESSMNNEIIFCLQEFRFRKNTTVYIDNLTKLFDEGFCIVFNLHQYIISNCNELFDLIKRNEKLYIGNIILTKTLNKICDASIKYNDIIEECDDDIIYRFAHCKIFINEYKYFYLFNFHLISSWKRHDLIKKYVDILNKIVNKFNEKPDYCLMVGDYNYSDDNDRQDGKANCNNDDTSKIIERFGKLKFQDLWRSQHMINSIDYTYFSNNYINGGKRFDYMFASERFVNEFENYRVYISHETNTLWDKYTGFTDHSALVLVY